MKTNIRHVVAATERLWRIYRDGLTIEILAGLRSSFSTQRGFVDGDAFLGSSKFIVDSSVYNHVARLHQEVSQPKIQRMFEEKG